MSPLGSSRMLLPIAHKISFSSPKGDRQRGRSGADATKVRTLPSRKRSSQRTQRWREVDSNHRSPSRDCRRSERFAQRSWGEVRMSFGETESSMSLPSREDCQPTSGTGPSSTLRTGPPGLRMLLRGSVGAACPGSAQEGPARCVATATSLAKRRAGGSCVPTWASSSHAGAGTLCAMGGAFSKPLRRFSRSR